MGAAACVTRAQVLQARQKIKEKILKPQLPPARLQVHKIKTRRHLSSSAVTYAQAPQARQKNKFKPQTQGSSGAPTRLRCVKQNKTKCGCTIRRKTNKKI